MRNKTKILVGFFIFSVFLLNLSNYGNCSEPIDFQFPAVISVNTLRYNDLIESEPTVDNNYRYWLQTNEFSDDDDYKLAEQYLLFQLGTSSSHSSYGIGQFYLDDLINLNYTFIDYYTFWKSGTTTIAQVHTFITVERINSTHINYEITKNLRYLSGSWIWLYPSSATIVNMNVADITFLEFDIHHRNGYAFDPVFNNTFHGYISQVNVYVNTTDSVYEEIQSCYYAVTSLYNDAYGIAYHFAEIFGNIDLYKGYNNLRGIRFLEYNALTVHYTTFDFPTFTEHAEIYEPQPVPDSTEPTGTFWYYDSISIQLDENETITIGNWTFDYPLITTKSETAKYFYDTEVIDYLEYGQWWDVLVNALIFIANAFIAIVNLILLFVQFLGYLAVIAFNWIIMFLIIGVIVGFIWNFIIKYALIGILYLAWVVFYIAVWIWQVILVPAFTWLVETGLPLIVDVLIIVLSLIFASLLWLLSLGTANWTELYNNIVNILDIVADTFVELFTIFATNIGFFLSFSFLYVYFTGLLYCKFIYVKARGYNERAEDLKTTYDTYANPIKMALRGINRIILRKGD